MEKTDKDIRKLNMDMKHVLNDARHFLSYLKGRKHEKGLVKKDIQLLKTHLEKLIDHLNEMKEVQA